MARCFSEAVSTARKTQSLPQTRLPKSLALRLVLPRRDCGLPPLLLRDPLGRPQCLRPSPRAPREYCRSFLPVMVVSYFLFSFFCLTSVANLLRPADRNLSVVAPARVDVGRLKA